MVYCGKPSKGCLACRSRKTRCDRQTPACSQCVRAKRECPGYRNQLDLMFRNESDSVIGKATSQKPRNKQKSSSSSSNATTRSATPVRKVSVQSTVSSPKRDRRTHEFFLPLLNNHSDVPGALSPSIESRALSFYRNREAIWLQNFDMVESICSQANTEDYLLASLSAVGLASYAASVRSPKLMLRAQRDYGHALALTNEALRSPVKFTNDSTLFAVMALGVFEAVAGNGAESLDAWNKHLKGASELVKLRGPMQLTSEAGQRMFNQINSNLIFYSITNRRRMPEHVMELRKFSEPFIDTMDSGWRISKEIINFANLRAKISNEERYDRREVVQKALEMDDAYADIADKRPPHWRGKIIRDDSTPDAIWNGFYVVYPDFWVAQMLNTMRIFRIHTLEILREQLHADSQHQVFSPEEAASLEKRAITTMLEMQAQILASIPQYAPWGVTSYPSTSRIEPWHAYQVLWALYLAANLDVTTREVSQWALQRFQVMDKEGGIEHAGVFAQAMTKRLKSGSGGSNEEWLARPLKMDPFDWSSEGWAIVHATILSAQINKPKTPPTSPKPPNQNGPPLGWNSSASNGTSTSPMSAAGIPKNWSGPPPPGWKPPAGFKMPPPGWVPPPGFQMPSGSSTTSSNTASPPASNDTSNTSPMSTAGIPKNWSGPAPSWWRPGMGGPPSQDQASATTNSPQAPLSVSSGPPMMGANGIPVNWKGPPPPGWVPNKLPPSMNGEDASSGGQPTHSQSSSSRARPPVMGPNGIPLNWSGPPPPGWSPNGMSSNMNGMKTTDQQQSSKPSIGPPVMGANGIPIGWKGPPPPGWKGKMPPGFGGGK